MLLQKLKLIPDTSGVYLFYDKNKRLLYVGKASSLKSRVKSYFQEKKSFRPIEEMMGEVADIKWETTGSALEAAILEGEKIKKLQPKYNIKWRDDKSWNYLGLTRDKFPRLVSFREHELKTGAKIKFKKIFGPFPGLNIAAAMKILRRIFKFSECKSPAIDGKPPITPLRKGGGPKPCFYRQLSQCLGVCTGEITAMEYRKKVVVPLVKFLSPCGRSPGGGSNLLARDLKKEMSLAAKNKNFEEAARLRDQIRALNKIQDVALINKSFTGGAVEKELSDSAVSCFMLHVSRIEGYDISNLGAGDKVGSMVVFDESGPIKSEYKKFNIKTVAGQSDVDCLAEVLRRRLKHSEWPSPDIFLIDGGLPQVNTARRILSEFNLSKPIVGIAKGPRRKKNQFFYADSADNPPAGGTDNTDVINWIKKNKNLLLRVRDEAHRFAIAFNRAKRRILTK